VPDETWVVASEGDRILQADVKAFLRSELAYTPA